MRPCCQKEIASHLASHRDVARCDECSSLLLAYGNEQDFKSTCDELSHHDVAYDTMVTETLWIVAKHTQ